MLYAIFESGGKQFKAVEGSYIEVDHLQEDVGKKVSFDKVLLLTNDKDTQIGTPFLKGASVDATVISHIKAKKIIVFKYRAKQRYRVKTGHRQQYTRLMVNSIAFSGKAKASTAAETAKEPTAEKPAAKKSSSTTTKKASTSAKTTTKKTTTKPAAKTPKTEAAKKVEN